VIKFVAGIWNGSGRSLNIGVLGGTFDPIHLGHLSLAEEARARFALDEVLFVPAGRPWLKVDTPISAVVHRVEMVRLAIADRPCFKLSTVEIEWPGPSYTVDTIAELQAQFGANSEIFFVLGRDKLAELPRWREPARLVQMCTLVVAPRPGYPYPDLDYLDSLVPGIAQRVIVMDKPEVDISASDIRNRVARGLSIRHLVPGPVERYIKQHKLYTMGH
jgi:nicotinate-nucleotide adenylyltransferase